MFFSWPYYTTLNFPFQGAFLLKKYEAVRKHNAKIVQKPQMSACESIDMVDVLALVHIRKLHKKDGRLPGQCLPSHFNYAFYQ